MLVHLAMHARRSRWLSASCPGQFGWLTVFRRLPFKITGHPFSILRRAPPLTDGRVEMTIRNLGDFTEFSIWQQMPVWTAGLPGRAVWRIHPRPQSGGHACAD